MGLPLVVIPDYLATAEVEAGILAGLAEVRTLQTSDEREIVLRTPDARAIVLFHDIRLTGQSLASLPQLVGIVRVGVGYDNVDIDAATQLGIVVCNVPDYGTEDVADHALMMLLAIVRRLTAQHAALREGGWGPEWIEGAVRLRGRTCGVIGCGRIGTAFALRAKALGMNVVIYDPYQPPGLEKALGVERAWTLEEFLPRCEMLSLHCPRTDETHHILNERTLRLLPRGAYVVNTARGGCIDLDALHAAMESGQLAAAALDVVEIEPLAHEGIRRHPRILLTPHTAYYTVEGYTEMRTKAAQEAARIVLGQSVRNPVNHGSLTTPRLPALLSR